MSEHEQHEIEDISDVVDHINNLPDCILEHILSFMPTKEVVKTSILSTRWKNLWASVPNIDIDDDLLCVREVDGRRRPDVTSFVKFVERVLRLRDASNIKKFRLSCYAFREASKIRSWISYAIMHNVHELDLKLLQDNPSVIPRSMFNGTSLVSLRMDRAIELPSHVSFPCLKTFHFSYVRFLHDEFTEKLLPGCPVLEELVLLDCRWVHSKNVAISSSTLNSLTIHDLSFRGEFCDPIRCKIKIYAANLTYFEYFGYLFNEITLNNTPSLDKAFIHIPSPRVGVNKVACRAIDLLKQLQYVVSLRLSNDTLKTLSFAASTRFMVLTNLTHLTMTTEVGMRDTFSALMGLLSSFPVLQSICFSEGFNHFMRLVENHPVWSSMPVCMTTCLKTVTLNKFHGYNSEICILRCILKYACVFERMDIRWSETSVRDLKRKTKVIKELEEIERSSTACVIKLT